MSLNWVCFKSALVGVFATTALLLAAIGLYGVMANVVATRRREFGIRMACGAVRQDLIRQVFRGGLGLTTVGLLVGLACAVGVAQLLASELYQVKGCDHWLSREPRRRCSRL